jgi:hypothetical protein
MNWLNNRKFELNQPDNLQQKLREQKGLNIPERQVNLCKRKQKANPEPNVHIPWWKWGEERRIERSAHTSPRRCEVEVSVVEMNKK